MRVDLDILRCPATGHALKRDGSSLVAEGTGARYPVVNGAPVLIDESTSLFRLSDVAASGVTPTAPRALSRLARAVRPRTNVNSRASTRLETFVQALAACKGERRARVLVVGGGTSGEGMGVVDGNTGLDIVQTDVYLNERVDVACDGHQLPFGDAVFDGVVIQAVLEHVLDPQRVVDEIHRVLAPHGVVYAETPFLQGVHEGAYDFTRYTDLGHRRLFSMFVEIQRGVAIGPAASLLWAIRYFLRSLPRRRGRAPQVIDFIATCLLFWIARLDRLVVDHPGAYDAASGLYFLGRRSDDALSDRDIVRQYRGTFGQVTVERGLSD